MTEIIFQVEEAQEGGYIASARGHAIFTEADTLDDIRAAVREAVRCHFDDETRRVVRLHCVRDEVIEA
jgi:hypothetical protein